MITRFCRLVSDLIMLNMRRLPSTSILATAAAETY